MGRHRHQHRALDDCRVGRPRGRGARPYPHPHRRGPQPGKEKRPAYGPSPEIDGGAAGRSPPPPSGRRGLATTRGKRPCCCRSAGNRRRCSRGRPRCRRNRWLKKSAEPVIARGGPRAVRHCPRMCAVSEPSRCLRQHPCRILPWAAGPNRVWGRTPGFPYLRSIGSRSTKNIRASLPSPSASSRTRKAQYGRSTSSMMT